jgi:hypothetical protein
MVWSHHWSAAAWSAAFASAEEEGLQLEDVDLLEWGMIPGAFAFQAATGVASEVIAPHTVALNVAEEVIWDARRSRSGKEAVQVAEEDARTTEQNAQSLLLRDVVGNPFRPVALASGWRTPTVLALAQAGDDHRILPAGTLEPDRLTVLADALEETGCTDADILGHLRGPGPHVRGCHVLDLILGAK